MTLPIALLGAKALYLLFAWLVGAIVASWLSDRKGYGERPGLATGLLLSLIAILVWLIAQAFVNIAVVLGVIPVLGVPLPLISAGGTAMISSMIAIGIVLSFARETSRESERAAHGISSRG